MNLNPFAFMAHWAAHLNNTKSEQATYMQCTCSVIDLYTSTSVSTWAINLSLTTTSWLNYKAFITWTAVNIRSTLSTIMSVNLLLSSFCLPNCLGSFQAKSFAIILLLAFRNLASWPVTLGYVLYRYVYCTYTRSEISAPRIHGNSAVQCLKG